ncbi:hypothetical protein AB0L00_42130 [Actinoallomurus sp. NPDC052308]
MDALVEEAMVDAYDEYEHFTGFEVMVTGHLELPFSQESPWVSGGH